MGEVLGGTSSVGQDWSRFENGLAGMTCHRHPTCMTGVDSVDRMPLTANFLTGLLAAIASDSLVIEGYPTTLILQKAESRHIASFSQRQTPGGEDQGQDRYPEPGALPQRISRHSRRKNPVLQHPEQPVHRFDP